MFVWGRAPQRDAGEVSVVEVCDLWICIEHVDPNGRSVSKLLSDLGIETVRLTDAEPKHDADVVVDCTGSATGLPTALTFVKPWGTVILKTTVAGEHSLSLAPIVIDEVRIVGSRCGPFGDAIAGLQAGRVRVLPLISARFALEDAIEALQLADSQPVLKVLLDVGN